MEFERGAAHHLRSAVVSLLSRAGGYADGVSPRISAAAPGPGPGRVILPGPLVLFVAARRKQRYAFLVKENTFIFMRKIMANLPGNRPSPQAGHASAPGRKRRRP